MTDKDLDKLAAEMKNIKPSQSAKQRAMDVAMAAFDAEFALDNVAATQEISDDSQGSTAEPRPTGHTTSIRRVETPRSGIMSKFKNSFTFNPKATMMVGSCAAALMFALVIVPNATHGVFPNSMEEKFTSVASALGSDEIVVTGSRSETREAGRKDDNKSINSPPSEIKKTIPASPTERPIAITPGQAVERQAPPAPKLESTPPDRQQAAELGTDTVKPTGGLSSIDQVMQKVRTGSPQVETENARRKTDFQKNIARDRVQIDISEAYNAQINEPRSRDQFEGYDLNPVTSAKETPVSTFSIDVDTASYSFFRSSINRGVLPPASSIRLEEMINYFPYDYEAPTSLDEPFKANVTVTPTPWNADTKLMHIGIKGYVPDADERARSNIVLLIDTSGSMRSANKLPLLINSFKLLLNTLDDDDTVSIVTYAGSAGTVLEPTSASDKNKINAALNNLRSGGSTAGAAGLELAYLKAQESFDEDGINRVILATDGDFNVGFSSPEEMKTFITKKRETGIFLSVLGFGNGNYNDHLMQALAQNGNGVAAYIDSLAEANKVLANEAGSALMTIAKDVKIQVEFNPATIAEYRLIGYETRALKREDFNNDKVDAGEINSGHSVTAIYEMTPVGSRAVTVDDLRYVNNDDEDRTTGSDEFAFVKIRHKLPNSDTSTLQTFPVGPNQDRKLKRASDDMRFATAVAAVGQKLRGDTQLSDFSYQDAIKLANSAKGDDDHGYRAEFIQLVRLVESMEK